MLRVGLVRRSVLEVKGQSLRRGSRGSLGARVVRQRAARGQRHLGRVALGIVGDEDAAPARVRSRYVLKIQKLVRELLDKNLRADFVGYLAGFEAGLQVDQFARGAGRYAAAAKTTRNLSAQLPQSGFNSRCGAR